MKRSTLVDDETTLGVKVGQRVRVVPKETPSVRGKLVELDGNNLVIETAPGYEEVFRRKDVAGVREITRNSLE